MKVVGYRYIICEAAPGEPGSDWHQHRRLIYRDCLEDIMLIWNALQDTNMSFESYMIEIQPVCRNDNDNSKQ